MTSYLKSARGTFALLALTLIIPAGCAAPGMRLESPQITIVDIHVQELTLFETVFQIELRIINSNDASFEIKGVDCKLKINAKNLQPEFPIPIKNLPLQYRNNTYGPVFIGSRYRQGLA
jgi:hypothetical protein